MLSARRWQFFKKFSAAQLREAQDVIAHEATEEAKIRLRTGPISGTFL
jgi:hypothetical protein